MSNTAKHSIHAHRARLHDILGNALGQFNDELLRLLSQRQQLDLHLQKIFQSLDYCKYIFVLDASARQISASINRFGADEESIGRDRSQRPYMQKPLQQENLDFFLSQAYISRNKKRPSVTAIQSIRDSDGKRVAFLGVDFDLRELPHSEVMYEEPSQWRQIKGDPAIRDGLFLQERIESQMDNFLDDVIAVHEALVLNQGVHHFQLHFSSSVSTIWHIDDPYVYRLLTMEELQNPDICLAYPRRPYFDRSVVPPAAIRPILRLFKALRFADQTIYLRSGSLNIVNGTIGLNFSCDGTHYIKHDEFLEKGLDLWFGGGSFPQAIVRAAEATLNIGKLEIIIEELAGAGCIKVNKLLYALENKEIPDELATYSENEREYIYNELKSVMDVYDGAICEF